MDSLSEDQWKVVHDRYRNLDSVARVAASSAAGSAAGSATYELIGMHILLEQGKKLTFIPMFDGI